MNDDARIEKFRKEIEKTATDVAERKHYWAYSHGARRSAYVHYNGRIIRVTRSCAEVDKIAREIFGPPNGRASTAGGQDKKFATWFLNG